MPMEKFGRRLLYKNFKICCSDDQNHLMDGDSLPSSATVGGLTRPSAKFYSLGEINSLIKQ